jgi:hypothetical protein
MRTFLRGLAGLERRLLLLPDLPHKGGKRIESHFGGSGGGEAMMMVVHDDDTDAIVCRTELIVLGQRTLIKCGTQSLHLKESSLLLLLLSMEHQVF